MPGMSLELRDKIIAMLEKLTGLKWIIAMNTRGEIERVVKGITREKAEKLVDPARKAVEVSAELYRIAKYTAKAEKVLPRTLYVSFNGEGIQVENVGEHIYVFHIDHRIMDDVARVFARIREERPLKCQKCGADLTLETYTCPRCGRIIPFVSEKCPYCGRSLVNKICPRCGTVIRTSDGSIVPVDKSVRATGIGLGGLILAVTLITAYTTPFPWPALFFFTLGVSAALLLSVLGLVESRPHV